MDLYEYQGKQLFRESGIPVSDGRLATTPEEAGEAAAELGAPVVVKAQVLTGGRGKAGGIKLAGSLVYQYAVTSEASYNENLDSALRMILGRLGAQPADGGQLAARAVDGLWWDSRVALPAKGLVTRRNFAIDDPLVPWLVQSAPASSEAAAAVAAVCGAAAAVPLTNPSHCVTGHAFADLAEIEIGVDDAPCADARAIACIEARRVEARELERLPKVDEQVVRRCVGGARPRVVIDVLETASAAGSAGYSGGQDDGRRRAAWKHGYS